MNERPFVLVETQQQMDILIAAVRMSKVIGLDTESTALSPLEGVTRLIQITIGKQVFVVDVWQWDGARELIEAIAFGATVKIIHNAKFETKFFLHQWGIELGPLFDTMLASQLIAAGDLRIGHGLDDVVKKWLDIELDKSEQASDWSGILSESQLTYAALDSRVLVPLYILMKDRLAELRLEQVAYEIEFPAIIPIAQMELTGFPLDAGMWADLLVTKLATREQLTSELTQMILPGIDWETKNIDRPKRPLKPKLKKRDEGYQEAMDGYKRSMETWQAIPKTLPGLINLGSHPQIKRALSNLTKLDWFYLTTKDHVLELYSDKFPIVAKLQEYRGADKAVTGYGQNWLDKLDADGRIRPDFNQIGAETGRMACRVPNVQNPPADKGHRGCFVAPRGRTFIIADYSQIELRIAAEFSQDELMLAAFRSGEDLHKQTASLIFGVIIGAVTKDQRDLAKRCNFGCVYGIQPRKFSAIAGVTYAEADDILTRYFATYKGLDRWLQRAAYQARDRRYVRTASGRLVTFTPNEGITARDYNKAMAHVERNGKNSPIQGTSADILKIALRGVHEALRGTRARIVNVIHDEIVVETDENDAHLYLPAIKDAMVLAGEKYVKSVPVTVDAIINDRWVKN